MTTDLFQSHADNLAPAPLAPEIREPLERFLVLLGDITDIEGDRSGPLAPFPVKYELHLRDAIQGALNNPTSENLDTVLVHFVHGTGAQEGSFNMFRDTDFFVEADEIALGRELVGAMIAMADRNAVDAMHVDHVPEEPSATLAGRYLFRRAEIAQQAWEVGGETVHEPDPLTLAVCVLHAQARGIEPSQQHWTLAFQALVDHQDIGGVTVNWQDSADSARAVEIMEQHRQGSPADPAQQHFVIKVLAARYLQNRRVIDPPASDLSHS